MPLVAAAIKDFELINAAKKKKKRKYKNSGTLRIVGFEKIRIDSFLDFIAGGCEVWPLPLWFCVSFPDVPFSVDRILLI